MKQCSLLRIHLKAATENISSLINLNAAESLSHSICDDDVKFEVKMRFLDQYREDIVRVDDSAKVGSLNAVHIVSDLQVIRNGTEEIISETREDFIVRSDCCFLLSLEQIKSLVG